MNLRLTLTLFAENDTEDRLSLMLWTNETGPSIELAHWNIDQTTYDGLIKAGVEESI